MSEDLLITLQQSQLGKKSQYETQYNPELLFPIPRALNRQKIGISPPLPFRGYDIWQAYELSWLNPKGKPIVAVGQFQVPCDSENLIESKSFKLYLNSFNNTVFSTQKNVIEILTRDLSSAAKAPVTVQLFSVDETRHQNIYSLSGQCLDYLDIEINCYDVNPELLRTENTKTHEILYSNLLKSNCSVTSQPDWGSIQIEYIGNKINHASLLQYLISFRNHSDFHEPCIERIFVDIQNRCQPSELNIRGYYTRRGGLDINPYRSSKTLTDQPHKRLVRQ